MKKLLAIAILLFFIGLACLLAYALTSAAFQTRQANLLIAKAFPGASIGEVNLSIGKLALRDLKLPLSNGCHANLSSLETNYSIADLFSKKINLSNLIISGFEYSLAIDKTSSGRAKDSPSANGDRPGGFGWELCVKNADLDISLLLSESSSISLKGNLKNFQVDKELQPYSGLLEAEIYASLPSGDKKALKVLAKAEKTGESISLKTLFEQNKKKILQAECLWKEGLKNGNFKARMDADNSDIGSMLLAIIPNCPSFSSQIYLEAQYENFCERMSAKTIFSGELCDLKKINPDFSGAGVVGISGEVEVAKNGNILNIAKGDISLSSENKNILNLIVPQAFSLDLSDFSKLPDGELANITLAIPSKMLGEFIPKESSFLCDDICAKLSLIRETNGDLKLQTVSPLNFTGISYSDKQNKIFENLNATLKVETLLRWREWVRINAAAEVLENPERKLSINLGLERGMADGKAKADLNIKGYLSPLLSSIWSMSGASAKDLMADVSAQVSYANGKISLKNFSASVDGEKNILKIANVDELEFDTISKKLTFKKSEIADIKVVSFPFAAFRPFVPSADAEDFSIEGKIKAPKLDTSAFVFSGRAGIKSLYVKSENTPLISDISASGDIALAWNGKEFGVRADKIRIASGDVDFAEISGSTAIDLSQKKFSKLFLSGDLQMAALLRQPPLSKFNNISMGNLNFSLEADSLSLDKHPSFSAKLDAKIDNLIARSTQRQRIGRAVSGLNFSLSESGALSLKGDLYMQSSNGETRLSAELDKDRDFNLKLDADSLVLEDVLTLFSSFSPADSKPSSNTAPARQAIEPAPQPQYFGPPPPDYNKADSIAKKDAKAFWYIGIPMNASIKIKDLSMSRKTILENATADIVASKLSLKVPSLQASLMGAPLKGELDLSFNPKGEIPYNVNTASISLKDFETAKTFKDPERAMLEGKFDLDASFKGSGNNAEHLFAYLIGSIKMASKEGGVIRLVDKNTAAGSAIGITGFAINLTSRILGESSRQLDALGEVLPYLYEIKYDSANLNITRSAQTNYNFKIENFEVESSQIYLYSYSGTVFFNPDENFRDWKIKIAMSLDAADGPFRTLLNKLGMATAPGDKRRFYKGPTFTIGGTISGPDTDILSVLAGNKSSPESVLIDFLNPTKPDERNNKNNPSQKRR